MTKRIRNIICASLMGLLFLGLPSCEKQAPRIRAPQRKIVDSLYSEQIAGLKIELDSICAESHQERVDYMVDSIMNIRLVERRRRLGY